MKVSYVSLIPPIFASSYQFFRVANDLALRHHTHTHGAHNAVMLKSTSRTYTRTTIVWLEWRKFNVVNLSIFCPRSLRFHSLLFWRFHCSRPLMQHTSSMKISIYLQPLFCKSLWNHLADGEVKMSTEFFEEWVCVTVRFPPDNRYNTVLIDLTKGSVQAKCRGVRVRSGHSNPVTYRPVKEIYRDPFLISGFAKPRFNLWHG